MRIEKLKTLLNFLIHRPIAVLTTFCGLFLLGLVVIQQLPVSLLPEIPIPKITVQVSQPNTTVREIENTVVRPLRNQLLQVGHLKDIQSRSRNSAATIQLEFDFGTNTNLAFIEVNEKIDQILGSLPRDMPRPLVLKANAADIPVFQLSILPKNKQGQDPLELARFSQTVIKRRIEQLTQVAFVDRSGFALPEIQLIPNQDLLHSLGLKETDIAQILKENNLELGSILVQDGHYQYNIRFLSALESVADIKNIYFNHQGRVLQIKDIADVKLQAKKRRGKYLFNGEEAIVLSVRKQADAQLFALKDEFSRLLVSFRQDYPELTFEVSNDQSELLEVSIKNLQSSLMYGAFFAFLILFLFFREWQAPILIGLVIPFSLVVTILGFYLSGLSINIISLSGLILGVGLMIDNSIIIIENIRQYQKMGYETSKAGIIGANEVIRPLISSALTTCSVFLPLIFLSGIGGALFYDQALSISIALGASLMIAYILLPTLMNLFSKRTESHLTLQNIAKSAEQGSLRKLDLSKESEANFLFSRGKKGSGIAQNFYTKTVDFALKHKYITLLIYIIFVGFSVSQLNKLPPETFPHLSRKAIELTIDWNESVSIETNERRVGELLLFLENNVEKSILLLGETQFLLATENQSINESKLVIYTNKSFDILAEQINYFFQQKYASANIATQPLKNLFDELFGGNKPLLIAHIQSVNKAETPTAETANSIFNFLKESNIFYSLPPQQGTFSVEILKEKTLIYNVSFTVVYTKLKTLFNQNQISLLRTSEAYIPVSLGTNSGSLYQLIQDAVVYNQQGSPIPLSNFVRLQRQTDIKTITAGKTGEALQIELDTFSPAFIADLKNKIKIDGNLFLSFTGQVFDNQQNIKELTVILGIVIMLLYLILAAQFESLILPFIVMLTVPIGIGGAIFILVWMNQSINLISIIGMIVMSGIVVNDAILKVDMMEKGKGKYSLKETIHIAGIRRLKPIVMTSLTTILALLPILFSAGLGAELQQPLAYAVIGGLVVGTIASLYFIPVLYYMIQKG